jgi:proteasome lid subunit RPN8/RPN11
MNITNLNSKVPLYISDRAEAQIKYLCNQINEVEWSGVLFYSVKGVFGKPSFKVTLEYILPMNKGSHAYTEFEYDNSVVEFMMEHPEAMEWKQGLIHSHNNMSAYFSGTDVEELMDNASQHNYYLSVVVNNRFDIVGRIAFEAINKDEITKYQIRADDGSYKWFKVKENNKKIFYYECEINSKTYSVDDKFAKYVEKIKAKSTNHRTFELSAPNYGWEEPKYKKYQPEKDRFSMENIPIQEREGIERWITFFTTNGESISPTFDFDAFFSELDEKYRLRMGELELYMKSKVRKFNELLQKYTERFKVQLPKDVAYAALVEDLVFFYDSYISAQILADELGDYESELNNNQLRLDL